MFGKIPVDSDTKGLRSFIGGEGVNETLAEMERQFEETGDISGAAFSEPTIPESESGPDTPC